MIIYDNLMDYNQHKEEINTQYLEQYVQTTRPTKPGANIQCLYAHQHAKGTDKNASMGYNRANNKYHCFSCNKVANIFDFIKEDTGATTDKEVIEYLNSYYNIEPFTLNTNKTSTFKDNKKRDHINKKTQKATKQPQPIQPVVVKPAPVQEIDTKYDFTEQVLKAHKDLIDNKDKADTPQQKAYNYFIQRGFTEDTIKKYKLGYTKSYNDFMSNYTDLQLKADKQIYYNYVIPIQKDNKYNTVMLEISNRDYTDSYNAKYRKPKGLNIPIYNEDYLKEDTEQTIFITEGIYDTLSIEQLDNKAMALNGIGYNRLIQLIQDYKSELKLIIMLDNDPTGIENTKKIMAKIEELNKENIQCINALELLSKYDTLKNYKDANEMLQNDSMILNLFLYENYQKININEDIQRLNNANISNNLDYFRTIEEQEPTKVIPTGFMYLDNKLNGGLRKNLYILGAISSLGKTALITQIADQIASTGQKVLYFSLEMDKRDIMARSIARHTYKLVGDTKDKSKKPIASNFYEIIDNNNYKDYTQDKKDAIQTAIQVYERGAKNLYIVSGRYQDSTGTKRRMNIKDIEKITRDFIKYNKQTPVIFIDYLQILAPLDVHNTDKQNVDEIIDNLANLKDELNTPIVAISSYNRDNYYEPANVTAFKESGAIEYGADVIIALQYKGIEAIYRGNDKEATKKHKIYELVENIITNSKAGESIPIELKVLKNRNGQKFTMQMDLQYNYGYFKENINASNNYNSTYKSNYNTYNKQDIL